MVSIDPLAKRKDEIDAIRKACTSFEDECQPLVPVIEGSEVLMQKNKAILLLKINLESLVEIVLG